MIEQFTDPANRFSFPKGVENTLVAKKFCFEPRENPEKPGRSLRVIFDARFPFVDGFHPRYMYSVSFEKAGNKAGNHYHVKKNEIFFPLSGQFEIHMARIKDGEKETVELSSENHEALFVESGIAHKVVAKSNDAILLVLASDPNVESDEFPYIV